MISQHAEVVDLLCVCEELFRGPVSTGRLHRIHPRLPIPTIRRHLRDAERIGTVVRSGSTKGTRWRLG